MTLPSKSLWNITRIIIWPVISLSGVILLANTHRLSQNSLSLEGGGNKTSICSLGVQSSRLSNVTKTQISSWKSAWSFVFPQGAHHRHRRAGGAGDGLRIIRRRFHGNHHGTLSTASLSKGTFSKASADLRTSVFRLQAEKHHPALVKVLCAELGVEPEALLDFELCLTDTQPAVSRQTGASFLGHRRSG